jgi:protein TonB
VVNTTVVEKTTVEEKTVQSKPMIDDKKDYLDKYLAQIRDLINKNVKYPSKAKKLSIEGIVIVKFKILEDGTVQNIEIIDGHKFLQTSTIEAIEEASKNFPKTNQSIEIQVPIEYKLI